MGKKLPNITHHKKGNINNNMPSVNKAKKMNNKFIQNQKKNKHKKHKNNEICNNFNFIKKDNISNNSNLTFNNINNSNNFQNPFIFNSFCDNKKEKEKDKPEWMSIETQKIQNINSRFNSEIYEYVNYIIPKNSSLSQRQNTKQRLINIIRKYQPQWKIFLFGSFSQNTSTVFSDLDFAIISDADSSRKKDLNELIYIMKILRNDGFSRNIRLIRARVPILKATCSLTGINVDISVNRDNGYKAARIIRNILERYKILKPIIIILKILLKKNNLNEAPTGGMSSFLLFHLVYFFYLTYQKRIQNGIYKNINIDNVYIKEKENISSGNSQNNNNYNNLYEEEEEDNYDEEKEMSLDSNSDEKWDNKSKKYNSHGILITKGVSSTDEEEYSNDDSNLLKNGNSSSNSEEEPKFNNYKKNNFRIYNKNDNEVEDEDEDEEEYEEDNNDYLANNFEEEKKNDENNNINIGHFLFTFLKFYGKEFDYKQLGFSLNENNFGNTFFKVERIDMDCSNNICVESIQEQGVDVGKACYNYPKIVFLFRSTYDKIKNEKQNNTCSILQTLGFPTI